MSKNKVKYGLKNVHYAVVTETVADGKTTTTYGTPKAWPGAVDISFDAEEDQNIFYADDIAYEVIESNNGYSGDFESADVPEEVFSDVMGNTVDDNGVYVESAEDKRKYIALMFEIGGDVKARRMVFYKCSLTRPSVTGHTKEDSTDPQTDSVSISIIPRPDDARIKAFTGSETDETVYADWYKSVYVPVKA